jgi:hypothetical protein
LQLKQSINSSIESIEFTPKEKDGSVDVIFRINSNTFEGKTLVAFEQLFNAEYPETVIAHHEDINDEEQSVHIPKIRTTLGKINEDRTVIDTITYENLIPNKEYEITSIYIILSRSLLIVVGCILGVNIKSRKNKS